MHPSLLSGLLSLLPGVVPVANAGFHPLTGWNAELGAAFSEVPGGVWNTGFGSRLAPVLSFEGGNRGGALRVGGGFHSGLFAAVLQPSLGMAWEPLRRGKDPELQAGIEARLMVWLVNLKGGMWGLEGSALRSTLGFSLGL